MLENEELHDKTDTIAKVFPESDTPRPSKLDLLRPKPFHGDGDQDKAGAARRFIMAIELYFELSSVPRTSWFAHARLYLEGSAADYMHTASQSLTASERTDWSKFCELLSSRFGNVDPDSEFVEIMEDLTQGSLTTAEYTHQMLYCFNDIQRLPMSQGDRRYLKGLNPSVKRVTIGSLVRAP